MAPIPVTVYYSPVSLASYMLQYTLAIRGAPTNPEDEITIEEKEVDIHFKLEQLSEFYLLNVNPKGKVPALTSPSPNIPSPLPDSLAITNLFAQRFPALKPPGYEAQIDDILHRIHAPLPYFILSFGGGHPADHVPKGFEPAIRALLEKGEVQGNGGYRRALEGKLSLHTGTDLNTLFGPESVRQAEKEMRRFLEYVDEKLPSTEGWLFGLERPSAADAHVVALAVRLCDVGREGLLPEKVRGYVERARGTEEWRGVMGGLETTMCQG
ncbi:hypothetical protein M409DRAFT_16409 [Zasmidium cellare ATCC 36951]|uniref:GST N-terminal domain-containing protein n=1 Tax=Zasmidium cellare ATCC 36951 TaxID=1080233 RepID=A0A6A6D7J1_ZASCE|nr:uncharacterized protein M409DRAFT_16409 [Zasmidium cellare ATCC 36951]KAF2174139.1 hypothetical protein M409DRAFT_16409 [Zasmidium cellare ATCC 36951]